MIPIFLCEDNTFFRSRLQIEINQHLMMENYDMEILLATENPLLLIETVKKNPARGIYFLDIHLGDDVIDGFELAKRIRQVDPRGFLIFITTHDELALETFRYQLEALDYIIKDEPQHLYSRVTKALSNIWEKTKNEQIDSSPFYSVKIMDEIRYFPIHDILFFETSPAKHRIILHTNQMQTEFFGSLNEIESSFPEQFLRIHRSFLIHTAKVKTYHISSSQVEMSDGSLCLVSRTMRTMVRGLFGAF